MAREAREKLVVDLLTDKWTSGNTFGETPSIIYGRDEAPSKPFISVEQPDEGPIGGGETGYDGIDSTQGVPHQTISGTVPVHLFASDKELDNATTESGKVYLTGTSTSGNNVSGGAVDETQRIIRGNAVRPSNPKTGNTPVELLSAGAFTRVPEPDEPGTYHYVGSVDYIYSTANEL